MISVIGYKNGERVGSANAEDIADAWDIVKVWGTRLNLIDRAEVYIDGQILTWTRQG